MQFKKVTTALATGALMLGLLTPVVSADSVTISGNGNSSVNVANSTSNSSAVLTQENNSVVITSVNSSANTGGNNANGNTGGTVGISTGAANSTAAVTVLGNSNNATVGCGCLVASPSGSISILGNGQNSVNVASVENNFSAFLGQANNSFVLTGVKSKAKTGKNKANGNTGGGVTLTTGGSNSGAAVVVTGNTNNFSLTP